MKDLALILGIAMIAGGVLLAIYDRIRRGK
jgi:hypothetical protein